MKLTTQRFTQEVTQLRDKKGSPYFALSAIALATALTFSCAQNSGDKTSQSKNNEGQPAKAEPAQLNESHETVTADQTIQPAVAELMVIHDDNAKLMGQASRQMAITQTDHAAPPPVSHLSHNREMYELENHFHHHQNTENYQGLDENSVKLVSQFPVSTFSVDVDTGSYTNARRMLNQGYMPPKDAIRVEEFINYFDYQYERPSELEHPFSISTDVATSPWNNERHLIRIGLQGYEYDLVEKDKNLVFLVDVSGSMNQSNKLPLLKRSLVMLSQQLSSSDKVSIVIYAGASGVVLEPTTGNNTAKITAALEQLSAGGSTNGASGIELAYQMAEQAFVEDGVNRVVLATDGDFNVGMVDHDALIGLIEKKRKKGIALTTLGFGTGNYNDHLMEQLADAGNGNYAYIDTINEARKVLVDEMSSTMQIIAKDVKVQIEFNPNQVAEYRLIGYENRVLNSEDFNNDKVDAGDIGAGHSVTALYEVTLVDSKEKFNDDLRYDYLRNDDLQDSGQEGGGREQSLKTSKDISEELAHVKLRYKQPQGESSLLIENIINKTDIIDFQKQSSDFQFATAVAAFAQLVKDSRYTSEISYDWVIKTANNNKGDDAFGYRSEFIQLARNASSLDFSPTASNN